MDIKVLVKNSSELIERLNTCSVGRDIALVKLDLDHVYLSGEHKDLIQDFCSCFQGDPHRNIWEEILWNVLVSQFVESAALDVYRVTVGSGMGAVQTLNFMRMWSGGSSLLLSSAPSTSDFAMTCLLLWRGTWRQPRPLSRPSKALQLPVGPLLWSA